MSAADAMNNDSVFQSSDGYGHPADKMFSMYLKEAEKVDRQMVEDWKGTTDGILIFAGLFSAVVTAFLIESYKGLSENTDTDSATVALLVQISSQLAVIANSSQFLNIQPPTAPKTDFYPSTAALVVNTLWFLSLSLSLVCALAATLVQYWARNYTRSVERFQQSVHKRALIRAFMFEGLEKSHVSEIVDAIPTLIHVALFLFLTGLVTFLHEVNLPIAYFVLVILVSCAIMYGIAAILPLLHAPSTLQTPFSSALWYIWQYCSRIFPSLNSNIADKESAIHITRYTSPEEHAYIKFLESKFIDDGPAASTVQNAPSVASTRHSTVSISKAQEQLASVDGQLHYTTKRRMVRALTWIHGLANEDRELEAFLMAIPGLSMWESSLLYYLVEHNPQLLADIRKFFHRTVPFPWALGERGQRTRAITCMEAMYHLIGAVSSPIDWGLKRKIHQVPLFFVSDLLPYLRYCDKEDVSLVFCTITACLNLTESTLATTTRELVFYPDLSRSRQYIDKLLQFKVPEPSSISGQSSGAFSGEPRLLIPFEFVISTTLSGLSDDNDRVSVYEHTLNIVEAVWQSVQEPRARFHQTTFVNFLEKILVKYSGNLGLEPIPTTSTSMVLTALKKMLETLLEVTGSLSDSAVIREAIPVLSRYLASNPTYGVAKARSTLAMLESKEWSRAESTTERTPNQAGDLPSAI